MEIGKNYQIAGQSPSSAFIERADQGQAPPAHSGETDRIDVSSAKAAGKKASLSQIPRLQPFTKKESLVPLSPGSALCLTDAQKTELSQKVLEDVQLKNGFYEDKALTGYLQGLVQEIKSALLPDHP